MLYSVDKKLMTKVPHAQDYETIRGRISDPELAALESAINMALNTADVFRARQLTPNPIQGSVYEPVYNAVGQLVEPSSKWIGLLIWHVLMERDDSWMFQNADPDDPEAGKVYWRMF